MKENLFDTIAAIATPFGEGGISVIRISGNNAFEIISNLFSKSKKSFKKFLPSEENNHTIHFGYFFENNSIVDEVLVSVFKEPHSYTGENIIEISSHGGVFVTQKILNIIIDSGARLAEPGEFTKRAFLNDKIDLAQAEAVADLIRSQTDKAHKSSIKQLEGSLSVFISKVRNEILKTTALTELELDFAEEDLIFTAKNEILKLCNSIINDLKEIINTYVSGKVIREGVNVVIAGKPNSGKSSLFNALLRTERAIVSHISGTTRDYIEEQIIIEGILFNLTDTAGIRITDDAIETEGIKRSYSKMDSADLILYLIDLSQSEKIIKEEILYFEKNFSNEKSIPVLTKKDISNENNISNFNKYIQISVSDSLIELKKSMVSFVNKSISEQASSNIILTNHRHKTILEKTIGSLEKAVTAIDSGMTNEFVAFDLREALNHLGEITGETTNDEILNYIFSKFCIGK